MVINFVTLTSVLVLLALAALISFTGGQGAGNCLAGMIAMPILSAMGKRIAYVR